MTDDRSKRRSSIVKTIMTSSFIRRSQTTRRVVFFALASWFLAMHGLVRADDLSRELSVKTSAFSLNRVSNLYQGVLDVTNTSAFPISGPLSLVLDTTSLRDGALAYPDGRTAADQSFVLVPLTDGLLPPGASVRLPIDLVNKGHPLANVKFLPDGILLTPANSKTIHVEAAYAYDAIAAGRPVGTGFDISVDAYGRGKTDVAGRASLLVSKDARFVSVDRAPNDAGSALIPNEPSTPAHPIAIAIDDGGEVDAEGTLRFDQAREYLLDKGLGRISLRFLSAGSSVPLQSINWLFLTDRSGGHWDLASLFSMTADGVVATAPDTFFAALKGVRGQASIEMSATGRDGQGYAGSASFSVPAARLKVLLVAPPSRPDLPLADRLVAVHVLGTDLRLTALSDSTGHAEFPEMPIGNLALDAMYPFGEVNYSGHSVASLTEDSLVRLVMRGPEDINANVSSATMQPSSGAIRTAHAALGERRAVLAQRMRPLASAARADQDVVNRQSGAFAAIYVEGKGEDQEIQRSATLTIPKNTMVVRLAYKVRTNEYPDFVKERSLYNDVWGLSVVTDHGHRLFRVANEVNVGNDESPVWGPDATTGMVSEVLDVSRYTRDGPVVLILHAFSVNIGDPLLPTSVHATLGSPHDFGH